MIIDDEGNGCEMRTLGASLKKTFVNNLKMMEVPPGRWWGWREGTKIPPKLLPGVVFQCTTSSNT